jgi:hypothetical protein
MMLRGERGREGKKGLLKCEFLDVTEGVEEFFDVLMNLAMVS